MHNRDTKIEMLRTLPSLSRATTRDLRDLAGAGDVVSADTGRVICRADRRAMETFIVIDGEVDIVVAGTVVATLGRGELVGELGVIDGEPRSADIVAATDVTLLAISAPALRSLIHTSHAVRIALLRQMAGRLRRMDSELQPAT